jgi:alpha-ketoglutarate-dependent 2,4-dichlorophenoxyacetate dioxygenase
MPHATDTEYHHIQVKELAPTFAAVVSGVDFSTPVEKEVFDEIHRAIVRVSQLWVIRIAQCSIWMNPPLGWQVSSALQHLMGLLTSSQYGVLVFRNADLDDARHVAFAALFGELDDVKPYIALGRKNRFPFDELFDVSNQEDDGSLVKIGSKRHHLGLVGPSLQSYGS